MVRARPLGTQAAALLGAETRTACGTALAEINGVRRPSSAPSAHRPHRSVPCAERDGETAPDETLRALDLLVSSAKVRYVGASNYACWQLMKALGTADRLGLPRFASQQICYSLQRLCCGGACS
jgi:hypothetical protein